jgi:hypothetical protein
VSKSISLFNGCFAMPPIITLESHEDDVRRRRVERLLSTKPNSQSAQQDEKSSKHHSKAPIIKSSTKTSAKPYTPQSLPTPPFEVNADKSYIDSHDRGNRSSARSDQYSTSSSSNTVSHGGSRRGNSKQSEPKQGIKLKQQEDRDRGAKKNELTRQGRVNNNLYEEYEPGAQRHRNSMTSFFETSPLNTPRVASPLPSVSKSFYAEGAARVKDKRLKLEKKWGVRIRAGRKGELLERKIDQFSSNLDRAILHEKAVNVYQLRLLKRYYTAIERLEAREERALRVLGPYFASMIAMVSTSKLISLDQRKAIIDSLAIILEEYRNSVEWMKLADNIQSRNNARSDAFEELLETFLDKLNTTLDGNRSAFYKAWKLLNAFTSTNSYLPSKGRLKSAQRVLKDIPTLKYDIFLKASPDAKDYDIVQQMYSVSYEIKDKVDKLSESYEDDYVIREAVKDNNLTLEEWDELERLLLLHPDKDENAQIETESDVDVWHAAFKKAGKIQKTGDDFLEDEDTEYSQQSRGYSQGSKASRAIPEPTIGGTSSPRRNANRLIDTASASTASYSAEEADSAWEDVTSSSEYFNNTAKGGVFKEESAANASYMSSKNHFNNSPNAKWGDTATAVKAPITEDEQNKFSTASESETSTVRGVTTHKSKLPITSDVFQTSSHQTPEKSFPESQETRDAPDRRRKRKAEHRDNISPSNKALQNKVKRQSSRGSSSGQRRAGKTRRSNSSVLKEFQAQFQQFKERLQSESPNLFNLSRLFSILNKLPASSKRIVELQMVQMVLDSVRQLQGRRRVPESRGFYAQGNDSIQPIVQNENTVSVSNEQPVLSESSPSPLRRRRVHRKSRSGSSFYAQGNDSIQPIVQNENTVSVSNEQSMPLSTFTDRLDISSVDATQVMPVNKDVLKQAQIANASMPLQTSQQPVKTVRKTRFVPVVPEEAIASKKAGDVVVDPTKNETRLIYPPSDVGSNAASTEDLNPHLQAPQKKDRQSERRSTVSIVPQRSHHSASQRTVKQENKRRTLEGDGTLVSSSEKPKEGALVLSTKAGGEDAIPPGAKSMSDHNRQLDRSVLNLSMGNTDYKMSKCSAKMVFKEKTGWRDMFFRTYSKETECTFRGTEEQIREFTNSMRAGRQ